MSTPSEPPPSGPTPAEHRRAIGIDIGGTGVKAAVVDVATGELVSPRIRERTPQPSTPEASSRWPAGSSIASRPTGT